MKLLNKNIWIIGILALVFSSCQMQDLIVGKPEGIKVEELSRKNIGLKVGLPVENPNDFGFTVKGIDIDVYVSGVKLGTINKTNKVKIGANSNMVYPININVKPSELLESGWGLLMDLGSDDVELMLKGNVKVSKFLISKKVKLDIKHNVEIF